MKKFEVSVGPNNADFTGSSNNAIQAAIDRVAALGGGVVNIREGTYLMEDSIHLRTGVTVRGSGTGTILKKAPSVASSVDGYMGYGHYDVSVKEPEKFKPGMGIYIVDDKVGGFYTTVATIHSIKGNILRIDRMLNSDIRESNNGRVISVYPVISGSQIKGARVENLVIDGNSEENEYINGCRGGGIFLIQAHDITIKNVTVRNYNGDGISFQQCVNTLIEDCICENNLGHGIHPGSGSVGSVMRRIRCSNNGQDGVYYCLRVSYTLLEDCIIENNKRNGISIGHRDWDTIIRINKIRGNGRHGIYVRPDAHGRSAHRNLILKNSFEGNCRLEGDSEICIDSSVKDLHILENSCIPGDGNRVPFVRVNALPVSLVVHGNRCPDRELLSYAQEAFAGKVSTEAPDHELKVGPDAVPEDGLLHLGFYR